MELEAVEMTEAQKLDAKISDAIIEYPDALIVFVDPDGITHVYDGD